MVTDKQLMAEMTELVKEAQTSFHISVQTLKEDVEQMKKMYLEFSSSCQSLILEMTEDVDTLERVLRSAAKVGDHSKANNLLESLKTFFRHQNKLTIEFLVKGKRRQLRETQQVLDDYLTAKRDENLKFRSLFSDYLRNAPSGLMEHGNTSVLTALKLLQEVAPLCSVPDTIIPDQIYAVLTNEQQWFSATVGHACGIFQVGDEPAETLYECFLLLDVDGRKERISKKNIRVLLPNFHAEFQALASKGSVTSCSMLHIMDKNVAAAAETYTPKLPTTKALSSSGPAQEVSSFPPSATINSGDIVAKYPSSISNHLPPKRAPIDHLRSKELQLNDKKFKPKFSPLELKANPLQHAVVFITEVYLPNCVYVQIEDEYIPLYHQMQKDLQDEFCLASRQSASYCSSPVLGHPYALYIAKRWRRVLVEMSTR